LSPTPAAVPAAVRAAAITAAAAAVPAVCVQVFARASKYSLFDPAKEMVYIEMDADEKKQGKAAVDLVGSQIGKSGASWITQAFLLGCGSIAAAMPFTGVIFAGVILTWIKVRPLWWSHCADGTNMHASSGRIDSPCVFLRFQGAGGVAVGGISGYCCSTGRQIEHAEKGVVVVVSTLLGLTLCPSRCCCV
jgi:hypothetical protein